MEKTLNSHHQQQLLTLLKKARTDRGVTQEQLSLRIGMLQSDISKVERGVRRLDVLELRTWLAGLEISLPSFVDALEIELKSHQMLLKHARGRSKSGSN